MMTGHNNIIKIGIVDDHFLYKKAIKMVLSSYDNVQIILDAYNGLDLIEKLKEAQPDILLLDISMPLMGGLKALPLIIKDYPFIKVIILSIYEDESLMSEALCLGACSFLTKYDSPSRILKQIKDCYERP